MSVLENSTCSTAAGAAQWPTAADNLHARNFTAAASSLLQSSVFTSHQQNIGSSAGPAGGNNTGDKLGLHSLKRRRQNVNMWGFSKNWNIFPFNLSASPPTNKDKFYYRVNYAGILGISCLLPSADVLPHSTSWSGQCSVYSVYSTLVHMRCTHVACHRTSVIRHTPAWTQSHGHS